MATDLGQFWWALAWKSFSILNSVLASGRLKDASGPMLGSDHRALYNLLAIVHLAGIVWLGKSWVPPVSGLAWNGR